jgi:hypothetical protein
LRGIRSETGAAACDVARLSPRLSRPVAATFAFYRGRRPGGCFLAPGLGGSGWRGSTMQRIRVGERRRAGLPWRPVSGSLQQMH